MSNLDKIFTIPRVSVEGWYLSDETHLALQTATATRHMVRLKSYEFFHGGMEHALKAYVDRSTPEVLIVETDGDAEAILDQLDQLANVCQNNTKVIIVGRVDNVRFYRQIIDMGVSGYIVSPATVDEIIQTVSSIYESVLDAGRGKVVAVIGASGGAGTSTVAQNVAWTIAETLRQEILLVDGDVGFGTSQISFDQTPDKDISDAIFAESVDETFVESIITSVTDRLDLLPSPANLERSTSFDPAKVERLFDALKQYAALTIVDLPHEWSTWVNQTLITAHEIVVVGTPDLQGLRNVKNVMHQLIKLRGDLDPPMYVINNSGMPKRREVSTEDFVEAIGLQPAVVIGNDPKSFSAAMMDGKTVVQIEASPALTRNFEDLAKLIVGEKALTSSAPREPVQKTSAIGKIAQIAGIGKSKKAAPDGEKGGSIFSRLKPKKKAA